MSRKFEHSGFNSALVIPLNYLIHGFGSFDRWDRLSRIYSLRWAKGPAFGWGSSAFNKKKKVKINEHQTFSIGILTINQICIDRQPVLMVVKQSTLHSAIKSMSSKMIYIGRMFINSMHYLKGCMSSKTMNPVSFLFFFTPRLTWPFPSK